MPSKSFRNWANISTYSTHTHTQTYWEIYQLLLVHCFTLFENAISEMRERVNKVFDRGAMPYMANRNGFCVYVISKDTQICTRAHANQHVFNETQNH